MEKEFYKSMTFIGAVLLALTITLEGYGATIPYLMPLAQGLGALLTIFGIRRALPEKK